MFVPDPTLFKSLASAFSSAASAPDIQAGEKSNSEIEAKVNAFQQQTVLNRLTADIESEPDGFDCFQNSESTIDDTEMVQRISTLAQPFITPIRQAIEKKPEQILSFLQSYNITDKKEWSSLLKFALSKMQKNQIFNILHLLPPLNHLDPQDCFEIAKLFFTHRGNFYELINNFDKFANIEEHHRTDFAKVLFLDRSRMENWQMDSAEYHFYENLHKFKLTKEENFIELAKTAADTCSSPKAFCSSIKKFPIKDPKARADIAKMLFASRKFILTHGEMIQFLQDIDIQEQKDLVEILKLIAAQDPNSLSNAIANCRINSEADRIAIAEIAAKVHNDVYLSTDDDNGFEFSKYFHNYKIQEERARVKIAKIAAVTDGNSVSKRIANYNIKAAHDRFEVARIAVQQEPHSTLQNLSNYQLDETQKTELMLAAFKVASPYSMKPILDACSSKTKVKKISNSYVTLKKNIMSKDASSDLQEVAINWLNAYECICCRMNFSKSVRRAQMPYAQEILKYQDPSMRYFFLEVLVKFGAPCQLWANPKQMLMHLLLDPLVKEKGLTSHEYEQIMQELNRKDYDDSVKKEKVLKGLYSILVCSNLSLKEKSFLIKHCFRLSPKTQSAASEAQQKTDGGITPHIELQKLDAILSSGNAEMLKQSEMQSKKESDSKMATQLNQEPLNLSRTLSQIFTKFINLESLANFQECYNKTIAVSRNPMALLIYSAKVGSLPLLEKEATIKTLKKFTEVVLRGTYKEWRYTFTNDSHLGIVFHNRTKLFEEWKKGESITLGEFCKLSAAEGNAKEENASSSRSVDVAMYVQPSITQHIAPGTFKSLEICLNDPSKCKEERSKLGHLQHNNKLPQKAKFDSTTKTAFMLKLEVAYINLIDCKSVADQIRCAEKIHHLLIEIYGSQKEVVNDMETLLQQLTFNNNIKNYEEVEKNYTVHDTDDWQDMLLCGTEVAGSCLRISGTVSYTKTLAAYLADGKIRAIVVKDSTGKIVARRIMRLLWDDVSKTPVLFQERLYQNPDIPAQAIKAIDWMFKRRATRFQIPLVCSNASAPKSYSPYPNKLNSYGTPAPFEYVDATMNSRTIHDGPFAIEANTICRI